MSNNFVDLEGRATLLNNKLDKLSRSLQNSASFNIQEAYMAESTRILKNFYSNLDTPFFQFEEAARDNSTHPTGNSVQEGKYDYAYNLFWEQLLDALTVLFMEMENLESLSISNYNFAITESNRLTNRLKSVSSKVGDYILYSGSTLNDVFLIRDSFNNVLKIDRQSNLLTEAECAVNEAEGVVTLPVIGSETISIGQIPLINDDSNGTAGNNYQSGAKNNDISVILDNNADTWFEYERVSAASLDEVDPLVLELTIDLGKAQVINNVVINPNNFGTKTVIDIDTLETSLSGDVFTSIKDDIPIPGYEVEDEENVFTLAPSTSKYSGQGIYTFTPRKTRFIHLVLKQSEPYAITTTSGESKVRYVIGIRDITIKALKFASKGELVSSALRCPEEIKKVMLEVAQAPVKDSELTNIKYMISHNEGGGWDEIQPKHLSGGSGVASVKEIINYNNADLASIITRVPVNSLRLKIILEREDSNFLDGSSSLAKSIKRISELQGVPTSAPFTITLDNSPIEDSVVLVDPMFGSRGIKESTYLIKTGQENTQEDTFYNIPFKNIVVPSIKDTDGCIVQQPADQWLFVYIGGEKWTQKTQDWSAYTSADNIFDFNMIEGTLSFNPDPDNGSSQPPDNASIGLHLGPERLFPSNHENNHLLDLDFPTSNSKEDFQIINYGTTSSLVTENIIGRVNKAVLKNGNITKGSGSDPSSVTIVDGSTTWTEIAFINGKEEFASSSGTKFSVDRESGIIYFGECPLDNLTCTYYYIPKYQLTESDWDWAGDGLLKQSIAIKESGWSELELTENRTPGSTVKSFGLSKMAVVEGTLKFPSSNAAFIKPVKFIDGITEFVNATPDNKEYSVNYKKGMVYLSYVYGSGAAISVTYFYTNYEALYRIARKIDSSNYEVDIPSKQITIKDSEFFKYLETPNTTQSGKAPYYLVNYDYVQETRENVEELKDYFTPVVKDYTLKILKKGIMGVLS